MSETIHIPGVSGSASSPVIIDGIRYAQRIDDKTTVKTIYMGYAEIASTTSAPVWRMKKIDTTNGADTTWADGNDNFDNIWDDRVTLSYL